MAPSVSKRMSSVKLSSGVPTWQHTPDATPPVITGVPPLADFQDIKTQWFSEIMEIVQNQIQTSITPFLAMPSSTTTTTTTVSSDDNVVIVDDDLVVLRTEMDNVKSQAQHDKLDIMKEIDAARATSTSLLVELQTQIDELSIKVQTLEYSFNEHNEQKVVVPILPVIDESTESKLHELQRRVNDLEHSAPRRAAPRKTKKDVIVTL
jgi:hypothetical protein